MLLFKCCIAHWGNTLNCFPELSLVPFLILGTLRLLLNAQFCKTLCKHGIAHTLAISIISIIITECFSSVLTLGVFHCCPSGYIPAGRWPSWWPLYDRMWDHICTLCFPWISVQNLLGKKECTRSEWHWKH